MANLDVVESILCLASHHCWDPPDLLSLCSVVPRAAAPLVLPAIVTRGQPLLTPSACCGAGVLLPVRVLSVLSAGELHHALRAAITANHLEAVERCILAQERQRARTTHSRKSNRKDPAWKVMEDASELGSLKVLDWIAARFTFPFDHQNDNNTDSIIANSLERATTCGHLRVLEWWWTRCCSTGSWSNVHDQFSFPEFLNDAVQSGSVEIVEWWWARRQELLHEDHDDEGDEGGLVLAISSATASGNTAMLDWAIARHRAGELHCTLSPDDLTLAAEMGQLSSLEWWWKKTQIPDHTWQRSITEGADNRAGSWMVHLVTTTLFWWRTATPTAAGKDPINENKDANSTDDGDAEKTTNEMSTDLEYEPLPFTCDPYRMLLVASSNKHLNVLDWLWDRLDLVDNSAGVRTDIRRGYFTHHRGRHAVRDMMMEARSPAVLDWWVARVPATSIPVDRAVANVAATHGRTDVLDWWRKTLGPDALIDGYENPPVAWWTSIDQLEWWWEKQQHTNSSQPWTPSPDLLSALWTNLLDGNDPANNSTNTDQARTVLAWWWPKLIASNAVGSFQWFGRCMVLAAQLGSLEPLRWGWDQQRFRGGEPSGAMFRVSLDAVLSAASSNGQLPVLQWLAPSPPFAKEDDRERCEWTVREIGATPAGMHVPLVRKILKSPLAVRLWWKAMVQVHGWDMPLLLEQQSPK